MLRHLQRLKKGATPARMRQLWYVPPLAAAMGLAMVRSLVMAHILSIGEFSRFSNGVLVSGSFCMLGCFGLQPLLQRGWPMMLVRGQEYRGLVLAAQANLIAVGCAALGLLLAGAGLSIGSITPDILAVGLVHGLSLQLFIISTIESRSRGHALLFAGQNFARAAATLVLGVIAAVITHSAFVALLTEGSIMIVLSQVFFRTSTRYAAATTVAIYRLALNRFGKIDWGAARMMMAVSTLGFIQYSVDRWLASDRLDAASFAHYSFACIVLTTGQSVQALVNSSLYPFVARRRVQEGQRFAYKISLAISVAIFSISAAAAVPAYYILAYAIHNWYPQYDDVVRLLPLFLAIAMLRLSDFWISFLLVAHREKLLFKLNLTATFVIIAGFAAYMHFAAGHVITMMDAGILAAALTVATYFVTATAAAFVGRQSC
ncbi:MAG TPA: hypothetical protein VMV79_01970 [Alphaproteobacteria bacterium]|nr:hypothetical protein [Alphaproteobacteria bacterium]